MQMTRPHFEGFTNCLRCPQNRICLRSTNGSVLAALWISTRGDSPTPEFASQDPLEQTDLWIQEALETQPSRLHASTAAVG